MFPSFIYYATNGKRKLLIIILHIVWYIMLYIRLHDVTDVDVINVFYHKKPRQIRKRSLRNVNNTMNNVWLFLIKCYAGARLSRRLIVIPCVASE
jgi:hypothetical protein